MSRGPMSDATGSRAATQAQLGDVCIICAREEPCDCGPTECRCPCGRCLITDPFEVMRFRAAGG